MKTRYYPFFMIVLISRLIDLTTTYMFLETFNWNTAIEGQQNFKYMVDSFGFTFATITNLIISLSVIFIIVPTLIAVLRNEGNKLTFKDVLPLITWLYTSASLGAGISNLLVSQSIFWDYAMKYVFSLGYVLSSEVLWSAVIQYSFSFMIAIILSYIVVRKIDNNKAILFPLLYAPGR